MESRQLIEKSEQEKRPGKPPAKKTKSAASLGEATPSNNLAQQQTSITADPNSTTEGSDDDWSDDTPSPSSEEMDGGRCAVCATSRLLNQYLLDSGVINVLQAGKGVKAAADFDGPSQKSTCRYGHSVETYL
jgi:hypothetical protein